MNKQILLVEDNIDDEFLLVRTLKKTLATKVIVRRDGAEGIDYLRAASGADSDKKLPFPELVIVDINMPRMNGIEMIRQMKADPCLKDLPVAVLSSSFNPRDIEACTDLGITGYLTKPARSEQLKELFERIGP